MLWRNYVMNPMAPYFAAAKAIAANIPQTGEHGSYTSEMFQADYPQFFKTETTEEGETVTSLIPDGMLEQFIELANDSVLPSRWGSMWRLAAGLFVAHFGAMYLKTYKPSSDNPSQVGNDAAQVGVVKSATMGDTSVSYDNSAITAGTEKWGTWNATQYGAQLVTMARMVGMGGMYAG